MVSHLFTLYHGFKTQKHQHIPYLRTQAKAHGTRHVAAGLPILSESIGPQVLPRFLSGPWRVRPSLAQVSG